MTAAHAPSPLFQAPNFREPTTDPTPTTPFRPNLKIADPLMVSFNVEKPKTTFYSVQMTGDIAWGLLERAKLVGPDNTPNTKQRNLRPLKYLTVCEYADDMRDGLWMETHEAIAIRSDGGILDGQHRLWAVVEAYRNNPDQKPIPLLVCSHADPETFDKINKGKKRNTADDLAIDGAKNAAALAAAVKLVFCCLATEPGHERNAAELRVPLVANNWSRVRASSGRLRQFLAEHPDIADRTDFCCAVSRGSGLSASALIAARYILLRAGNKAEVVDEYFEYLKLGEGAPYVKHPAFKLRDWARAASNPASKLKVRREIAGMSKGPLHFRLIIQYWNTAVAGKQIEGTVNYTKDGQMQKVTVYEGDKLPGLKPKS